MSGGRSRSSTLRRVSDIGIGAGIEIFVVALATALAAAMGTVVQPIVVGIALRRRPRPARGALLAAIGPALALVLSVAIAIGLEMGRPSLEARETLDGLAFAWPLVALTVWIAVTSVALRGARA